MWIVRLALNRPYTFVVASLVLILLTPFILLRMPTDIFPSINIPVVSVVWQYTGLDAQEIEQRMNYVLERSLTTTVNDIEHLESNAYNGIGARLAKTTATLLDRSAQNGQCDLKIQSFHRFDAGVAVFLHF